MNYMTQKMAGFKIKSVGYEHEQWLIEAEDGSHFNISNKSNMRYIYKDLIGKSFVECFDLPDVLILLFEDRLSINIGMKDEDCLSPEAFILGRPDGTMKWSWFLGQDCG